MNGRNLIQAARAQLTPRSKRFYVVIISTATALAVLAVSYSAYHTRHAAQDKQIRQNQRVLKHACKGLLPSGRLRPLLSSDDSVVRDEYGTMLDRGQQSRALLDCALSWGSSDEWSSGPDVKIRAEAVLDRVPPFPDESADSDFPPHSDADPDSSLPDYLVERDDRFALPLPASADGSVRAGKGRAFGSLTVTCPNGLHDRSRTSEDLQISVLLPARNADGYSKELPKGDRLLTARTAIRVANWVSEQQNCGTAPLPVRSHPSKSDRQRAAALCSWLDPRSLGLTAKDSDSLAKPWRVPADRDFTWRNGSCEAIQPEDQEEREGGKPRLSRVYAQSWSGIHASSVYRQFDRNKRVPGSKRQPDFPEAAKHSLIADSEQDPGLALWAQSECHSGKTFHRVSVSLDPSSASSLESSLDVSKSQRKQLSKDVRRVLGRYLTDSRAWPKQSRCQDTKLLGEVEEWQESHG